MRRHRALVHLRDGVARRTTGRTRRRSRPGSARRAGRSCPGPRVRVEPPRPRVGEVGGPGLRLEEHAGGMLSRQDAIGRPKTRGQPRVRGVGRDGQAVRARAHNQQVVHEHLLALSSSVGSGRGLLGGTGRGAVAEPRRPRQAGQGRCGRSADWRTTRGRSPVHAAPCPAGAAGRDSRRGHMPEPHRPHIGAAGCGVVVRVARPARGLPAPRSAARTAARSSPPRTPVPAWRPCRQRTVRQVQVQGPDDVQSRRRRRRAGTGRRGGG